MTTMTTMTTKLTLALATIGSLSVANAAVLAGTGSTFAANSTASNIDVTSSSVSFWGYWDENQFGDGAFTNTIGTSGIGAVSVTNNSVGNNNGATGSLNTITFTNGDSPTSGTSLETKGGFGAFMGTEDNAITFNLNNLGAGTHTINLYTGHSSTNRIYDIDYLVEATDGNLSGRTESSGTVTGTMNAIYQLTFTTTDALADVTLDFGGVSGDGGNAFMSALVVETVPIPEPSSTALLGLGSLALIMRRRK